MCDVCHEENRVSNDEPSSEHQKELNRNGDNENQLFGKVHAANILLSGYIQ
jgi:hypothetical protein